MKWELVTESRGKVRMILPHFSPCNDENVNDANRIYRALGEEILSYAEASPHVRRYSAESEISEDGDSITVTILLSARVFSDGAFSVRRRSITDTWRGSRLISHITT